MRKVALLSGLVVVLSLVLAQPAKTEVAVFDTGTGEAPGFDNLVFTIDPVGRQGAHAEREIIRFLRHNRSLSGKYVRTNDDEGAGKVGAKINRRFMVDYVRKKLRMIEDMEDIFDDVGDPGDGYEYDLHIVHRGTEPGVLEGGGPYPIIIMCQGFTGGAKGAEGTYDWLASYYAEQGYVFAMPRFFENFFNDPRTGESNNDDILKIPFLMSDIASLQVSGAIDYLIDHFGSKVSRRNVTVIGHSNGGFITVLAGCRDRRIGRMALLSGSFKLYGGWDGDELTYSWLNVLDSYDAFRYLNRTRIWRGGGPAVHVQRGVADTEGCPPGIPCDWFVDVVPPGTPYDLSGDRWLPFEGCGGPCVEKTPTFYNWAIYEGRKETGVKDNPFADHVTYGSRTPLEEDPGKQEALRLLDDFFNAFPID